MKSELKSIHNLTSYRRLYKYFILVRKHMRVAVLTLFVKDVSGTLQIETEGTSRNVDNESDLGRTKSTKK